MGEGWVTSFPISKSVNQFQTSDGNQYYNPDPLVCLIGEGNEAQVHVDGIECTALIDSGAQVPIITTSFVKHLGF